MGTARDATGEHVHDAADSCSHAHDHGALGQLGDHGDHGDHPDHGTHGHHHHGHGHGHAHGPPARPGLAFALGIGLNVAFVIVEAVYGYVAHSVALVADAAHNLGDVLGLLLAWLAMAFARRRPTARRTYGWRKSTILAALANAVLIFVAVGGVAWEALQRLVSPAPVEGEVVMVVAAIGVVINGASALLFLRGQAGDANLRGAFLHLVADAAVSVGVVLGGLVIVFTGWQWLDPAISLVVSVALVVATWGLLRDALDMVMDAVPGRINPGDVARFLGEQREVRAVHDLHIWPMSTTEVALTAHVVVDEHVTPDSGFLPRVCHALRERYMIDHATLQLESHEVARACRLAGDDVV